MTEENEEKIPLLPMATFKHDGAYVTSDGSVRYPTEADKLAEAKRYEEEREARKRYREEYPFHGLIIRVIEVYDCNVDYPDIYDALKLGADINCLDANDNTPLDIILKYSADNYAYTYDLIKYFLERGAKLGKIVVKENMEEELTIPRTTSKR